MQWKLFKEIVPSTGKIYQQDFPKVAALKYSTKRNIEELLSWSALYLTFYQQKFGKNATVMDFVCSIDESYQWDFPKVVVLKRSTKGIIRSSYAAHFISAEFQLKFAEIQYLNKLFRSGKIYE